MFTPNITLNVTILSPINSILNLFRYNIVIFTNQAGIGKKQKASDIQNKVTIYNSHGRDSL